MYDTSECYMALCVAILRAVPPEMAFGLLVDPGSGPRRYLSPEDTLDMVKYRARGLSLKDIGEMYGISPSAVFLRVKGFKEVKTNER